MDAAARIGIVGGHGKTGVAVCTALDSRGVSAVPLGRADRPLSLGGFDAVYVIAPNLHPDEPAFVSSVLATAPERVVYHSVAAPYAPSMPHHLGKAVAEDLVRRSGRVWTILQPCAYLQNLLPIGSALRVPYSVDSRFGLVDLADVGEAAARVLLEDGHAGATYELGGPTLVSTADVAALAGVPAVEMPLGEWVAGPGASLSEREREWLAAMFSYYDSYGLPTGGRVLGALLGRTPASVAEVLARTVGGG